MHDDRGSAQRRCALRAPAQSRWGPEAAARSLRDGHLSDALVGLRSTLLEVRERYRGPRDAGPSGYFAQAVQVEPDANEALTRSDAVDAVARFFAELAKAPGEDRAVA